MRLAYLEGGGEARGEGLCLCEAGSATFQRQAISLPPHTSDEGSAATTGDAEEKAGYGFKATTAAPVGIAAIKASAASDSEGPAPASAA